MNDPAEAFVPPRRVRFGAIALAAALTAAMLVPLASRVSRVQPAADRASRLVIVRLPVTSERSAPSIATPGKRVERPRSSLPAAAERVRTPSSSQDAPAAAASAESVSNRSDEGEFAAAPAPSASAPLQLGPAVVRGAARASKSAVLALGEANGAYLGDGAVSRDEQLANAVAHAAKPDCLRSGGSLLSVFVVAYELLRERCR